MAQIPTKRQLREWILDEKKSTKEYAKYGFDLLSADEARHARVLKNFLLLYKKQLK